MKTTKIIIWIILLQTGHLIAGPLVYTDRDTFLTAIADGTNATVTFNGLAPAKGSTNINNHTYEGITFSSSTALVAISATRPTSNFYQWNSEDTALGYYYGQPIKAVLPTGQFAVGADIMINEYKAGGIAKNMTTTITLEDDTAFTINSTTFANPKRAFIGLMSDVAIKQITFAALDTSPGKYYMPLIDNVTISTTAVPEPTTTQLLVLLGILGVVLNRWRRKTPTPHSK